METESKQSAGADASATPWLDNLKELMGKYHLPGVDVAALVDWQRKDMEALTEANRQAFEGIKTLIDRRNEILQETLAQWQATIKDATPRQCRSKLKL